MSQPARISFWNVPNSLSVARLALSVAVFGLIAAGAHLWALGFFIVAAVTDAFDGYFARLFRQVTVIGRQLDPLVDKVLITGAYVFLLGVPDSGIAPWMVAVIVIRELLVQGLRSLLEGQGKDFSARKSGKFKMILQCVSVSIVLFTSGLRLTGPWIAIRDVITWAAVILTLYSGVIYTADGLSRLDHSSPSA